MPHFKRRKQAFSNQTELVKFKYQPKWVDYDI